jgi:hypothetical protein
MLGLSRIGAALVLAAAATTSSNGSSNGNGASQTGAAERPPPSATRQFSFSGTARGQRGETYPEDHLPELQDPVRRMAIFEEMEASDDAVHTAIDARRQEGNAANWVLGSEDKSPRGTEILEFSEDNWYPWTDDAIRWLMGGGVHFGFGLTEPVYMWNDAPLARAIVRGKIRRPTRAGTGRRIYLAKLAHVRQTVVDTFRLSESGDLKSVHQAVFDGMRMREIDIPAEKALLWSYNRQGDDYWGRPPTRHAYKAWSYKTQLERLHMLHEDRFAVGVPVIEFGEGWSPAEEKKAFDWWSQYRSGAEQAFGYPKGGSVDIKTADKATALAMLDWVRTYDLRIAKTYLTQGTELGSTETGARALGESFFEQLAGIVQADCEDLAAILNDVIAQLVIWNFGPQETYPAFAPSQRVHRAGGGVASVLQQLIAAKAIHPRPEDEAWLRDVFGLPAVELKTLEAEQEERDAVAQAVQDAANAAKQNGSDGGAGAPDSDDDKPKNGGRPPLRVAAVLDIPRQHTHQLQFTPADGAPEPAIPRRTSYRTREYSDWEARIVRPEILMRDLDLQTARLAGEVKDVLREIDADLARQAESLANEGASALAGSVRDIRVPARLRSSLRRVLLTAARRARDYGSEAVRNEVRRQAEPEGIGPQRSPSISPFPESPFYQRAWAKLVSLVQAGEDDNRIRDLQLQTEVDRAAEEEADRREQSVRTSLASALMQAAAATASALTAIAATAVQSALESLSTGRTESNVQGVVNVGFGIGRSDGADAINEADDGPELVAKVYSAVMDLGTCDECAKWDGAEFPIGYPEDYRGVQAPNPRCEGGYARCRCAFVYVTDLESVPLVPAAKGPTGVD